jgi:DNA-binding CsgD family transcriptional regulator
MPSRVEAEFWSRKKNLYSLSLRCTVKKHLFGRVILIFLLERIIMHTNASPPSFPFNRPGIYGSKDLQGNFTSISEELARNIGYASANRVIERSITDYQILTKAVEFADKFVQEDQIVYAEKTPLKIFGYYHYHEPTFLFGEKIPLFDKDKNVCGLYFQYIDVTKTIFKDLLLTAFLPKKADLLKQNNQVSYYLKQSFDKNLLTKRESECLFYLLRGKSGREIAMLLDLSTRTIEEYLNNIKDKFKCCTKGQLIEKALSMGFYYLIPESILTNIWV